MLALEYEVVSNIVEDVATEEINYNDNNHKGDDDDSAHKDDDENSRDGQLSRTYLRCPPELLHC